MQHVVAFSYIEVEYISLAEAIKEKGRALVKWTDDSELGFEQKPYIFCDSQPLSKNCVL